LRDRRQKEGAGLSVVNAEAAIWPRLLMAFALKSILLIRIAGFSHSLFQTGYSIIENNNST
jgi:hypothetical protein